MISQLIFVSTLSDVEAAAELGRTLLERNRELESTVRHQQAVIDDQTQEMEVIKFLSRDLASDFSSLMCHFIITLVVTTGFLVNRTGSRRV